MANNNKTITGTAKFKAGQLDAFKKKPVGKGVGQRSGKGASKKR